MISGLVAGWLLTSLAGPHPNSFSLSEIHIREQVIQVHLRCQVLSLGEVIEPLDEDLDGTLEPGELKSHRDAIVAYVSAHYALVPGAASSADAADPAGALSPTAHSVTEAPRALDPLNEVSEWVDIVLDYAVADIDDLVSLGVRVDLFQTTSPLHRDSAAVVWNGLELGAWQFAEGSEVHVFEPTAEMLERNAPPWRRYLASGAKRSSKLPLDAACLVLLFVAAARWRSARSALISAGLFLALAAGGAILAPQVDLLPQHVRFFELTIPLALAYVGLDDLLHGRGRTRVLETCVFGLVLGGREAARLAPELAREATATEPLVGFAGGFAGALLLLATVSCVALRDRRSDEPDPTSAAHAYAKRGLRRAFDLGAIGYGLWLFWAAYRGAPIG